MSDMNTSLLQDATPPSYTPDPYDSSKPSSSSVNQQPQSPQMNYQQQPPQQPMYQQPPQQYQQQQYQQIVTAVPQPMVVEALPPPQFGIFQAFSALCANGQLGVYTDKSYYISGELVTGRVMANVVQPISCRSVCVQVIGYEKAEWHELRSHQHRIPGTDPPRYRTVHTLRRHRGRRSFFNVTIRVNDLNNGVLMPGQYIFPFQYQLPDGLPGSFYERRELRHIPPGCEYEDDSVYGVDFCDSDDEVDDGGNVIRTIHRRNLYRRPELLAIVNYKLRAVVDVNGIFNPNLRATAPVIIHPRLLNEVRPATAGIERDVMVCCCINKGRCKLNAHFDKNSYVPGETAMILSDVDNQSKKPLVMVVKLWRTLELKSASWGGRKVETTVVVQQKYEGIEPFTRKEQKMPLPLPVNLKPTTAGEFVRCSYKYTVECQVSWGGDIKLEMPVLIYAPQPPSMTLQPLF